MAGSMFKFVEGDAITKVFPHVKAFAAVVGGTAGVLAFTAIVIGLVWFCKSQYKNLSNKNLETGSPDPSALVEWNRRAGASSASGQPSFRPQEARQFTIEELEQATNQFSESSLIGYGSSGPLYTGLLRGRVVAIKKHIGSPRPEFVAEVYQFSSKT